MIIFGTLVVFSTAIAGVYKWQDNAGTTHVTNIKPDWWTDEMDDLKFSEIHPPDEPTPFPGKFVGDKENYKFHLPSCEQIYTPEGKMAIPESKIIWFKSAQEALDKNFVPCSHCKPAVNGKGNENGAITDSGRKNQ